MRTSKRSPNAPFRYWRAGGRSQGLRTLRRQKARLDTQARRNAVTIIKSLDTPPSDSFEGFDQVGLFSEYVRLSQQLFVIKRQLNGEFVSDPDQLLADWYVSDEFSALMQKHAAIAKKVAITGAGQ
jgi:hypothetical protein